MKWRIIMKQVSISWCIVIISICLLTGCGGSQKVSVASDQNRELSLQNYLEGSLLDQKGDYAKAILEYQEALQYQKDPAIYYALAKDYAQLGKYVPAEQMGLEAVKLEPNNRSYRELLANIYINARDLEKAIREYNEVVRIDSQYSEGWQNLARLTQIYKPIESINIYKKIIGRFGPNIDAYFQIFQIYTATGEFGKATEAIKQMSELDPSNVEIKKNLGDALLRQDSTEAALKLYQELVELYPNDPEIRASIAHIYLIKQDYEQAAAQFESVITKDTLSVEDQLRFGQIFVAFIQKDSAVVPYALKLFNKIQQSHPDDWRPYWFLGAINNITKNDSISLVNYEKVRNLAKWNPDGWVGIASIYYDKDQIDSTINILTEAKKYVQDEFRVYFLLGIAYQKQHKMIDAASALEKAAQLNNKSIETLGALGLVYEDLKRPDEADSAYEHALILDPQNHIILNNYAYGLAERGVKLERALKMSKEAVDKQPTNQSYLDTYGWICFRLEKYEEAEQYVRKAIELGSSSAVIHEHLGDIYYKLGKEDKAMEFWQKAYQIDSSSQSLKNKIQRGKL
jgi:Flp pilus assembly protein TadD